MPTNMHMKIDSIPGESRKKGHEDQIEITSFQFAMQMQSSSTHGGGSAAGRVQVNDLVLTKYMDKADAALMRHCCSGTHIDTVTISCEKAGGETTVEYLKLVLTQVLVTHHSFLGAQDGDQVSVNVALNFAKYEATYTPQMADGSAGAATTQEWNVAENA